MSGGGGIIIISGKKASGVLTDSKNETIASSQAVADYLAASNNNVLKNWGSDLQVVINQASS